MSLVEFFRELPFAPDPFQRTAADAIAAGDSVVVTAPTGAGKTVVAEAAVHLALERRERAFYTTPLKALSNQKFGDFQKSHGADRVGLLTGDNSINGAAPIVVMTTEVLRNMIYSDPAALHDLGVVILDEVHYLQDPSRGGVWEEVIIHLPPGIPLVCLSATIANAPDFADWVRDRRGRTALVVETHRPVPLESRYLVTDRFRDGSLSDFPVFDRRPDRPNPAVVKLLRKGRGRRPRFVTPRRIEVAQHLQAAGLLPAIYFIFSRAGCNAAAERAGGARLGLTTPEESAEIRRIAISQARHLDPNDLAVLGFPGWLAHLEAGIGAHHAGLVPAFKEAVETLFAAGLVKLVFATETLSLGINMPARTVVLENLSRFTGEHHEILRPGDYTQLTGRAGRRGIDRAGTAFTLYSRHVPFDRVATIAAAGAHPLRSSFAATYNMTVNLIANYERAQAEQLLTASFAQHQATGQRRELAAAIADTEREAREFAAAAECSRGDIWRFLGTSAGPPESHAAAMRRFAQGLAAGDIIEMPGETGPERWILLARSFGAAPRLRVLSTRNELKKLRPEEIPAGSAQIGALTLPEPFRPQQEEYRDEVAASLRRWEPGAGENRTVPPVAMAETDHVAGCPRLAEHRAWARRSRKAEADAGRLRGRLGKADRGLVDRFRSMLRLLEQRGFVRGWGLTESGERLRYVYSELDILVAEAVARGVLDDLTPAEMAAVTSAFVYEPRNADEIADWPTPRTAERGESLERLWLDLTAEEAAFHLPTTRKPERGFAAVAYYWASGIDLGDLFEDGEFAAGDFVRNCRQLLDLLRQIRESYARVAGVAAHAATAIDRGVVAAGGLT